MQPYLDYVIIGFVKSCWIRYRLWRAWRQAQRDWYELFGEWNA